MRGGLRTLDLRHQPLDLSSQIRVRGHNRSSSEQIVVIRIDDQLNPSYAERANIERRVGPGQFELHLNLAGLHTPSGRPLPLRNIMHAMAFRAHDTDAVALTEVTLVATEPLPEGALGWDLGPSNSAVWPGFMPLDEHSQWLSGQLQAVDRGRRKQAADALTIDGIRGIRAIQLPLSSGHWRITLWLRDSGEWEYLPHPLTRTVHANGQLVHRRSLTASEWIARDYLALSHKEPSPTDNSWTLYGQRLRQRVSFEVKVVDGVRIELNGQQPEAGFVAAILAEPSHAKSALAKVEQQRAQWWQRSWSIEPWPISPSVSSGYSNDQINNQSNTQANTLPNTDLVNQPSSKPGSQAEHALGHHLAAANSRVRIRWSLPPGVWPLQDFHLREPVREHLRLSTDMRWGQWRLQRSTLSSTRLIANDGYLRARIEGASSAALPRTLELLVDVPAQTPAGLYRGELLGPGNAAEPHSQTLRSWPFTIEVLPIALPPADRPAGVYLERPVHFDWFDPMAAAKATECDMAYLRKLGLTALAPPLTTPNDAAATQAIAQQLASTQHAGFHQPVLAYTPLKRLIAGSGVDGAVRQLQQVQQQLLALGQTPPLWVSADEPSNPGSKTQLQRIYRYARAFSSESISEAPSETSSESSSEAKPAPTKTHKAASPAIRLAGHLNHPEDDALLEFFDAVLLNAGYELTRKRLAQVKQQGVEAWFYNLHEQTRLASGFYLWRSGAAGYLHWHARMPTADPFDPTDGREDDVQLLYPSATVCPHTPDIDAQLLDLSDGIQDLRWLLWLQQQSSADATALVKQLRQQIPTSWKDAKHITNRTLSHWRSQIMQLAKQQ
ncbi:hypothetical protein [Bacterioplanes sanyensis]|nr:hypothetical protein [Bacterioplanes sanyensis]